MSRVSRVTLAMVDDRNVLDDPSGCKGDGKATDRRQHGHDCFHVGIYRQQGPHLSCVQYVKVGSATNVQERSSRMGCSRYQSQRESTFRMELTIDTLSRVYSNSHDGSTACRTTRFGRRMVEGKHVASTFHAGRVPRTGHFPLVKGV